MRKLKVKALLGHVFVIMENSMNGVYFHNRNLGRVMAGIGLMNVTFDLFGLV